MGFQNGVSPVPAATGDEAQKICIAEADSSSQIQSSDQVEPERIFLLRAAIRHDLVARGQLDVHRAFDSLVTQFLDILYPLPEMDQWAEALWDNPGWQTAAAKHHRDRGADVLIVKLHPKVVGLLGKLL